jgi:hypothetical protein
VVWIGIATGTFTRGGWCGCGCSCSCSCGIRILNVGVVVVLMARGLCVGLVLVRVVDLHVAGKFIGTAEAFFAGWVLAEMGLLACMSADVSSLCVK